MIILKLNCMWESLHKRRKCAVFRSVMSTFHVLKNAMPGRSIYIYVTNGVINLVLHFYIFPEHGFNSLIVVKIWVGELQLSLEWIFHNDILCSNRQGALVCFMQNAGSGLVMDKYMSWTKTVTKMKEMKMLVVFLKQMLKNVL